MICSSLKNFSGLRKNIRSPCLNKQPVFFFKKYARGRRKNSIFASFLIMMKKVVRFFRNRAIKAFLKTKKACTLPDVTRRPSVAVLVNDDQLPYSMGLIEMINRCLAAKCCTVFIVNTLLENNKGYDNIHFITKKSFGFFGLLKGSDIKPISSVHYDMLLNLTAEEESILADDYVVTLFDTSFRVSFGESRGALYDLVLDAKREDIAGKIEVLCKYLKMLTGK